MGVFCHQIPMMKTRDFERFRAEEILWDIPWDIISSREFYLFFCARRHVRDFYLFFCLDDIPNEDISEGSGIETEPSNLTPGKNRQKILYDF